MVTKKAIKAIEEVRKEVKYGTMGVDWQERTNFTKLRNGRFERAQAHMKQEGVAAIICGLAENKRYVSGCRSGTSTGAAEETFALGFAESPDISDCCVYEFGSTWLAEREHVSWIKPENYRNYPSPWFHSMGKAYREELSRQTAKWFKQDLKERGIEKEKVAIDTASGPMRAALEKEGINLVDGYYFMQEVRSVKTPEEVECIKMAGAICDIGYGALIDKLRPGLKGTDVQAIALEAMARAGYMYEPFMIVSPRSGPETAPNYIVRMPTDRIIQPGDLVYLDISGVGYLGYRTCYYRTFKVGTKPTAQEKDWFKRTREILYAGVDVLRDGITTADVAEKWPKYTYWKIPNEACAVGNAMGHNLGLHLYDVPFISRQNSIKHPQPIKKGMTIAMETWAGQDDIEHGWRGGCRLESVYLITEKGHENLYAMPDTEIICPPHGIYC